MHNDIKEILFTTEQIEAKAAELAKQLEIQPFGELPELYIDGFDSEGIWEQIRLRV